MAATMPDRFQLLAGSGSQEVASFEPILTGSAPNGVEKLVENTTFCYAKVNRRQLLEWGHVGSTVDTENTRHPISTSSASFETVFEARVKLSKNTDKISLWASGDDLSMQVIIYDEDDLSGTPTTLDTLAGNTGGSTAATFTDTSTSLSAATGEIVTLRVQIKYIDGAAAELYGIKIYEEDLVAADLPG